MSGEGTNKFRIDVILKVQLTLDYMKLCVDHDKANGEGVPVDIVVMPDFVVDVQGEDIIALNKEDDPDPYGMLSPVKIGSRAGRVLYILSHLRDLDDEGFRLHYIAKTGQIGRVVLNDRLNQRLLENNLQPLRFPLLTPAPRTRHAAINPHIKDPQERRQVLRVKEQDILKKEELERHFYNPMDKIRNARALFFATDSIGQFLELFDIAILGEKYEQAEARLHRADMLEKDMPGARHVIVDFSALHGGSDGPSKENDKPIKGLPDRVVDKIKDVLEIFNQRNDQEINIHGGEKSNFLVSNTLLTFLVREDIGNERVIRRISKILRLREKKDLLLVYDSKTLFWTNSCKQKKPNALELPWESDSPDSREAFIAGILLYRAVSSAWECIPRPKNYPLDLEKDWTLDVFPDPYDDAKKAEKEWTFSEARVFGEAMTKFWFKSCVAIPDKRSLLSCNYDNPPNLETMVDIFSSNKSPEWFCNVSLLALEFIKMSPSVKGRDDKLSRFISLLSELVAHSNLKMTPGDWKSERHKVLKLSDFKTLQAQFALQTLKRMSKILVKKQFPLLPDGYAYLSDLDGTLIQSSVLRGMCLKRAFQAMVHDDLKTEKNADTFPVLLDKLLSDQSNDFKPPVSKEGEALTVCQFLEHCHFYYNALIYKQWKYWQVIFDTYAYYAYGELPKDFRQVWNHPLSYPAFIWVLNALLNEQNQGEFDMKTIRVSNTLADAISFAELTWRRSIDENKPEEWGKKRLLELLEAAGLEISEKKGKDGKEELSVEYTTELKHFHEKIATLDTTKKRAFDKAVEYYWDVKYEPFSQTREVLRTLRDVLGVKLYIATEGHHDTQVKKIRTVGLEEFFPESVIMSTGAASNPFENLRQIQEEIKKRDSDINLLKVMKEKTKKSRQNSISKAIEIENFDVNLNYRIKDLKEQLEEFANEEKKLEMENEFLGKYKKHWDDFVNKTKGRIYSLVVTSVMLDPNRPLLSLRNLRHLELNLVRKNKLVFPRRFAMIGDREDKDIRPFLKNWKPNDDQAVAVRLLTADHKDKGLYWDSVEDKDKKAPRAHYVAWSPLQALLLLSAKESWGPEVIYSSLPEIFRGYLADEHGNIDEDYYHVMTWGKAQKGDTFGLINHLIIQSTIRKQIKKLNFTKKIEKKLSECRKDKDRIGYQLAWEIMEQIFSIVTRSGGNVKEVAEQIRDVIINEARREFGGQRNIEHQVYRLLHDISVECDIDIPIDILDNIPPEHSRF
jgi:phosphoglycolate phosphatase-like HAD superfamily hydrolase